MKFLHIYKYFTYICNAIHKDNLIITHKDNKINLIQYIMTRQEFNDRTGFTLNEEQYKEVEAMYIAAGNMDKDVFCKDYKKHNDSALLAEFYNQIVTLTQKYQACREIERNAAELLIGKAHAYNDTDFRKAAIRLIGEKRVVLMTIVMGLPLFEEDAEYIKNKIQ